MSCVADFASGVLLEVRKVKRSPAECFVISTALLRYYQMAPTCLQGGAFCSSQLHQVCMLLFVVFHTVNMTNTGKLLGMCPTFIGMRVRLCTKVSSKFQIVHHAPGTVLSHQFDSRADLSWQLAGFDA